MTNRLKNNWHLYKPLLLLLMVSTLCCACHEQTVYHSFRSIPTDGWLRTDTLCFDVAVPDSQTHYHLSLDIRHRNTYPYQNIWLSLAYESSDYTSPIDTLQFSLADSQGMWEGQGWGGLYQKRFPLQDIQIEKAGNYTFKINHILPDSVLPGVNDIGILLEKSITQTP